MKAALEAIPLSPDSAEARLDLTFEAPREGGFDVPQDAMTDERETEEIALNLVHVKRRGYYRLGGYRTIVAWAMSRLGFDEHRTREMLRLGRRLERRYAQEMDEDGDAPSPVPTAGLSLSDVVALLRGVPSPAPAPANPSAPDVRVAWRGVGPAHGRRRRAAPVTRCRTARPTPGRAASASPRGRRAPNVRQPSGASFSSA